MMPILLPVLVRRSMRETTVAAMRPAVAPARTARANSPNSHLHALQRRGVIVKRMAGEEKADRFIFASAAAPPAATARRRQPKCFAHRPRRRTIRSVRRPRLMRALCARRQHRSTARKHARAVGLELVEGARGRKTFQHALVDGARIDARGEVGEIAERLAAARRDDRLHCLRADALQRGQRIDR